MKEIKKFYSPETEQDAGGYGYQEDDVKISPFHFGLNAGVTYLKSFQWIPNGGTGGAEQEALEIIFNTNGTDKSYRRFPVTKAFKAGTNEEITDPNSQEMKDAMRDFNAVITHILHCFRTSDEIKAGFSQRITSFKEFCRIAASLLPTDYATKPLDIFMQFQWQMDESANRTYLDIPKKMSYGRWLAPAQPGTWVEKRAENIQESTTEALWYENEKGEKHPFIKNGWFMLSNFARQQRVGGNSGNSGSTNTGNSTATANTQQAAANTATAGAVNKSQW